MGVPSDRATEETVEACLDEMSKCRPFFIAILEFNRSWVLLDMPTFSRVRLPDRPWQRRISFTKTYSFPRREI